MAVIIVIKLLYVLYIHRHSEELEMVVSALNTEKVGNSDLNPTEMMHLFNPQTLQFFGLKVFPLDQLPNAFAQLFTANEHIF